MTAPIFPPCGRRKSPEEFWLDIEGRLWNMIGEINNHYYSRPHHVDNFAAALAMTNKLLKLVQENPPAFKGRPNK